MKQYPEPTVGAIIFNPDNKVLLCRSKKWSNKYVFPGGHIELGEKMEDALVREVKEETGLDVFDIQLISLQEAAYSDTFEAQKHFIFIDFLCKTDSSDVVLNDEAEEFEWVLLEEIESYDLGGFTRRFFEELKVEHSTFKVNLLYNYI
ncbi:MULTISPECIES: NUDIX domain-containing protein [unclassified Imperialibacter]|uniref:NUDIX domain-containing protein n=1 Tax=unclassified Imperialibacter TaxID=2629706 RepID=UPI00125A0C42|nr:MULTISPECIES: NUDIX domain-containing protein [unclassified Imperialibacter]CAD5283525.1 ADP-ribose pyrophosphatase [Imperialibacter sp. 89]CAD5286016.1 ADP-ribose pyrophosphatase [Imperialibacter sp. 75]VVT29676.1 ADP-ribose pyrophosphatase [Imperialibacter sp. EC-SDR9]